MSLELGGNSFPNIIANLLKEGNTLQALTLFTDNKNSEEICNNAWDLVPVVARCLTNGYENSKIEVFKCCQKLIQIIAEHSKPEEVLLQFIEEIETAEDDTKLLTLLKPLESVLLRVPDKRVTSLGWCFNAIKSYLQKVETLEDLNLVGEERLLLESNETVGRIINLYGDLIVFCDVFVNELINVNSGRNVSERKQVIEKFLIELLGKPLAFLDMDMYKTSKPQARVSAEILIEKYFRLCSDPCLYLEMYDDNYGLVKPNDLSLGVFYYLIFSEEVCIKCIPKIYSSVYILQNSLNLVNELLTQESQLVVEKGVNLMAALLKSIDHLELSYLLLDSKQHSKFCKVISNIIAHNEQESFRKKALQILQNYLWSFEYQGRYLLIINLMRNLSHSGLKGNIITQYKEMISFAIKNGSSKALPDYYKGHKLSNLLQEFTKLKHKEETDLVDESDQIVSTLNLLRYLILIDNINDTGVHSYLDDLEEGYFKQLKTGIEISKEHYFLKIKEVSEERYVKDDPNCKVSVTVSGKNLFEMPKEKKLEIINLSLTTLDVIDSLLNRLKECINISKTYV